MNKNFFNLKMATIWAKSKYGRKFKIDVEDKHKYANMNEGQISIVKPQTTTNDNTGYNVGSQNVWVTGLDDKVIITQGPGEDQRIGNKVYMKFLHFTYAISLDGTTLSTYLSHGQLVDTFFRFRVMVVKFDSTKNLTGIIDWFHKTFIYFRQITAGGEQVPVQSVHQTKLRESTEYTGKFKILYDKKLKMGKKKTVKIANISIPIKANLTFNENDRTTDDAFQNIYAIIIGPSCNILDMDAISYDKTINFGNVVGYTLAHINSVLKYEYYDI